jgi:CheY-like chemotaxis protein
MAKVLFVEDDVSWQEILEELLETAGHETQRAPTIDAALGILRGKQKYDVIVFDLKLGTKSKNDDPFTWLDAFIQGILMRKLQVPPIIILSGVELTKIQIIQAFTEYRGYIFNIFEKSDLTSLRKAFLQNIKNATNLNPFSRPKSIFHLFVYTFLLSLIALIVFAILVWSVKQIPDPQTQQTILQIGGGLIVVIAIFIAIFSQNAKLQDVAETIQKIWRG